MLKHFATCLLALAALFAALAPAAAEKRVALVIGNAAYQNAPPLRTSFEYPGDGNSAIARTRSRIAATFGRRSSRERAHVFSASLHARTAGSAPFSSQR